MKTAEEIKSKLASVKMYGRNLSEFLLPDQIEFIEKEMIKFVYEAKKKAWNEAIEAAAELADDIFVSQESILKLKK